MKKRINNLGNQEGFRLNNSRIGDTSVVKIQLEDFFFKEPNYILFVYVKLQFHFFIKIK